MTSKPHNLYNDQSSRGVFYDYLNLTKNLSRPLYLSTSNFVFVSVNTTTHKGEGGREEGLDPFRVCGFGTSLRLWVHVFDLLVTRFLFPTRQDL